MSIKVEHVTKIYGTQKALDDVSFEVKKGEVLGFLGPNGAGKSTMMKIISCFIPPTSGKVTVGGYDILDDSMAVRQMVGYLPESNPLYYDMYVKEYLEFVASLYDAGKNRKEQVKKMIELTGLGREQHKQIGQLSKGYKQRVGIAQALIHDPEVLILDEPTSGLDPNQLVDVRELIRNLGREKTVMFSSHIMQEVEAVSDRIIIIDKGKLMTDRTMKDSLSHTSLQSVIVEFDGEVSLERLKQIEFVLQCEIMENRTYKVVADYQGDLRKLISEFARENNLLVLTLKLEDENLEGVFRKFTN
ncbi:MAG: gliding motility-associated ABC transporter ATP-binding subunit GldA [Flavobacteriales bacterium]|nr:gliding motility-associated ABC transporter ATP-binding subunit GldA [Flavobacteriales bacterium]